MMRTSFDVLLFLGSLVIANAVALAHEGESHRPAVHSIGFRVDGMLVGIAPIVARYVPDSQRELRTRNDGVGVGG